MGGCVRWGAGGGGEGRGSGKAAGHVRKELSHFPEVLGGLVCGVGSASVSALLVCGVGIVPHSVVVLATPVPVASVSFVAAVVAAVAAFVPIATLFVGVSFITRFALTLLVLACVRIFAAIVAANTVAEGAVAALRGFATGHAIPAEEIATCWWKSEATLRDIMDTRHAKYPAVEGHLLLPQGAL